MPRVKSDAERGAIGAWLRRQRLDRGWSPERVVLELTAQSQPIREDYYRGLEAGRRPGPELLAAFEAIYGTVPPAPEPPPPQDGDMAAVLRELVAEVRLSRMAQDRNADVLAELLGHVLGGRLPLAERESEDGAPAHQGSRG